MRSVGDVDRNEPRRTSTIPFEREQPGARAAARSLLSPELQSVGRVSRLGHGPTGKGKSRCPVAPKAAAIGSGGCEQIQARRLLGSNQGGGAVFVEPPRLGLHAPTGADSCERPPELKVPRSNRGGRTKFPTRHPISAFRPPLSATTFEGHPSTK